MNYLPLNSRPFLIRVVLISMVALCLIGAGVYLEAQIPDIAKLHKQAKGGDAEAQFELAKAYLYGDGVTKDTKQGAEWLEKAAKLDHPAAQQVLSYFYLNGREQNIPKNPKLGLEWLRKSADHGNAVAECALAIMYRDGDVETSISRDPHEAATWFRKAARQPDSPKSRASLDEMLKKHLISEQEANWRPPFSLVEVETGLKGSITNKRMGILIQKFGVDFKSSAATEKRLADDGADTDLLHTISASKRAL
jgi:TPR repeat protein